jgi:hypothetical protein
MAPQLEIPFKQKRQDAMNVSVFLTLVVNEEILRLLPGGIRRKERRIDTGGPQRNAS